MTGIRLAASNSPVEAAWAAYDAAALELWHMYDQAKCGDEEAAAGRSDRMAKAQDVARLWRAFIDLFEADSDPRPAA